MSSIWILKCKSKVILDRQTNRKVKLSIALHFFVGRDKYNIRLNYGMHTGKVCTSIWEIIDLVNAYNKLKIKFPNYKE